MSETLDEILKWYKEYRELQDRIVKEKVHDKRSPENTEIIIRAKELYSLLKKVGYFR